MKNTTDYLNLAQVHTNIVTTPRVEHKSDLEPANSTNVRLMKDVESFK